MQLKEYGEWQFYFDEMPPKEIKDCGKWMYYFNFNDRKFVENLCIKAIEEKIVSEVKHSNRPNDNNTGVVCFYISGTDNVAHKRVLNFFLDNNLIKRTKDNKLVDISFKFNKQTQNGEYGVDFKAIIKLSDFVNLESGKILEQNEFQIDSLKEYKFEFREEKSHIKINSGRIYGAELNNLIFNPNSNIRQMKLIIGNLNFEFFDFLVERGLNLNRLQKIEILISAGRSKELLKLYENFPNYSKDQKEKILLEEVFDSLINITPTTLEILRNSYEKNILEIKLGFTIEGEVYINEEIILNNEYLIMGNFNGQSLFVNSETYYVLTNKEVTRSLKIFTHKFDRSYPFNHQKLISEGKEHLISLSNDKEYNLFSLNELIIRLLSLNKFSIQMIEEELGNQIEDDINNPFILDEVKSEAIDESTIDLRPYQKEAINELVDNSFNGKLQMATGTGKTFTTLYGLKQYLKNKKTPTNITLVVPLKLLVDQWESQIKEVFGSEDIFSKDEFRIYKCYSEEKEWREDLNYAVGIDEDYNYNFIIFVDDSFRKYVKEQKNIEVLKTKNSMLIIDEAHNITKETLNTLCNEKIFKSHLALSATLYDEDDSKKNEIIDSVFQGTDINYDISQAIKSGYLCEYEYFPKIVDLDSDEVEKYKDIRSKINLLKEKEQFNEEYIQLKKEEANLISKAHRKVEFFEKDLENLTSKNNILVYSNQGNYGEKRYIDYISKLTEIKLNVKVEQITSNSNSTANKRMEVIKRFEKEEVGAITAIKCLDEGVDIPSIKRAFLLYSGGKSKEFIQRRGRILRKHPGKEIAYIHDYIVRVDGEFPDREIKRFNEYVKVAKNKDDFKNFLRGNNGK